MSAYAIGDRATWVAFANKKDLEILVEGDERLFNPYGVILVNPERFSHVKAEMGQTFIDWLVSASGQDAIASYRREGQQLFYPSAAGS
jgi:tungstate transport system substrate-binding protein